MDDKRKIEIMDTLIKMREIAPKDYTVGYQIYPSGVASFYARSKKRSEN